MSHAAVWARVQQGWLASNVCRGERAGRIVIQYSTMV